MKAASNLIMWLAMVLLVTLATVLGLVLLLLAELYCSPFIRRHRQPTTATGNNNSYGRYQSQSDSSPNSPLDTLTASDDIEKQLRDQPPENQDSGRTHQPPTENQVKVEMGKLGCLGDSVNGCSILYISNPIYDSENRRGIITMADDDDGKTPFETPDTSPSRLETEDSSGDEEISSTTPAVVALKDGSDTNSNKGVSSSVSSSPCSSSFFLEGYPKLCLD